MKSFLDKLLSVRIFLTLTAIAALLAFTIYVVRWTGRPTFGFGMYYTFSRMVLDHEDLAKAYDFDYFNAKMNSYGIPGIDMPNNMPTAALPMLPIAWLNAGMAKTAWMLISAGLFVWSLRKLFTVYGIPITQNLGLGLITFAFLFRPLYDGMALGQMYSLIMWLLVLSMPMQVHQNILRVSTPLAFALATKGYGIVQVLWFACRKNWRVLTTVMVCTLLVVLLSLPFLGSDSWKEFFYSLTSQAGSAKNAHVSYQSVNGFLHHILTFDRTWAPSPLVALPEWTVLLLSTAVSIVLIALVVMPPDTPNDTALPLSYSASVGVGVITFPLASEYHYVLFLPLIVGLAANLYQLHRDSAPGIRSLTMMVTVSSALMAVPIKYQQLQGSGPLLGLLAYPRLLAGLCLVLCFKSVTKKMRSRRRLEMTRAL